MQMEGMSPAQLVVTEIIATQTVIDI
jgi:hypothetical protein